MYTFIYPNNKPIFVTKESVVKTPYTFNESSGIWEPNSIEYFYSLVEQKHNNSNATIVDVGAQSGLYSLYARYLPDCKFHAFEPFTPTYSLLLNNLTANGITNVKTYNCALGSKEEVKTLHVPSHLGLNTLGNSPKRFDTWDDIDVTVKRLDDIFANETSLDYIKCDTEGWEYHVLKGAEESIRKWKPELFLEVNGENLSQCSMTISELIDYLKSLDYTPRRVVDTENVHFSYSGET